MLAHLNVMTCCVQTSVWYGCVLRGDLNSIRIGAFSNVQDKTVMHAARYYCLSTAATGCPYYHMHSLGNYHWHLLG